MQHEGKEVESVLSMVGEGFAIARPNSLPEQYDTDLSLLLYRSVGCRLPRGVYKVLEHTGSGLIWLPLAIAMFLTPSASQNMHSLAANLLLGLLIDLAYVGLLKGIVQRPRPVYNNASDFLLVVKVDQYSFPSGHAARQAFRPPRIHTRGFVMYISSQSCLPAAQKCSLRALGTPKAHHHVRRVVFLAIFAVMWLHEWHAGLAVAICVWAAGTALSRCLMGRHYLGDVLAGAVTGVATAATLSKVFPSPVDPPPHMSCMRLQSCPCPSSGVCTGYAASECKHKNMDSTRILRPEQY